MRSTNNSALRGYLHQSTDLSGLGNQASQRKFMSPANGVKSTFAFGKHAEMALLADPGTSNRKSAHMFPTLDPVVGAG